MKAQSYAKAASAPSDHNNTQRAQRHSSATAATTYTSEDDLGLKNNLDGTLIFNGKFILSVSLCLRRSTLVVSIHFSVVSSGKIRWTNWPHPTKLISPIPGSRRHMVTDPVRLMQPSPRNN